MKSNSLTALAIKPSLVHHSQQFPRTFRGKTSSELVTSAPRAAGSHHEGPLTPEIGNKAANAGRVASFGDTESPRASDGAESPRHPSGRRRCHRNVWMGIIFIGLLNWDQFSADDALGSVVVVWQMCPGCERSRAHMAPAPLLGPPEPFFPLPRLAARRCTPTTQTMFSTQALLWLILQNFII